MFSKAKRFEPLGASTKTQNIKTVPKPEIEKEKHATPLKACKALAPVSATKYPIVPPKSKSAAPAVKKPADDNHSQCSSSVKSFVTPKPIKSGLPTKAPSSVKKITKPPSSSASSIKPKINAKDQEELIKSQEVEIRNKDHTILEYNKQIEELKNQIQSLQAQINNAERTMSDVNNLDKQIAKISLNENSQETQTEELQLKQCEDANIIKNLKVKIRDLENQCENLEMEVCSKQVELGSLEEIITIRDSLCKDLQDKLTNVESCLEETRARLEMVKGHHALALEANESIRREYKVELETVKTKLEEEKQAIIHKCKSDQENLKVHYTALIESIKDQMLKERYEIEHELEHQLITKEQEMKAKLDQIEETSHEKLRICEIQFEERTRNIQHHCEQQQLKILALEKEANDLRYNISLAEEQNVLIQKEINQWKNEHKTLTLEKTKLEKEIEDLKEGSKQKLIDFENEKNKVIAELEKITKEKNKFEMSLSVTRDIVQVLTMRLRESDNEVESLENQVQTLTNAKEELERELTSLKNTLDNTKMECSEYKEALVNILKSKAALAKEHTRIMEHNVSLIESLQHVEKEAYRELGTIKNELIEDVELLKKESNSQIKMLRDEVENKRMLCELATEQAGQAAAAAEQARTLLAAAAAEIQRLEADNQRYQRELQDQQSLVVEVSLLRQENEELTMAAAQHCSLIDTLRKEIDQQTKLRKEMEQQTKLRKDIDQQTNPKSPSMIRKAHKIGKENIIVSPLRERNH